MLSFRTIQEAQDYIAKHNTNIVQTDVHTTKEMFFNNYSNMVGKLFQFDEIKAKLIHIDYHEHAEVSYGITRWELPYDLYIKERKCDERI